MSVEIYITNTETVYRDGQILIQLHGRDRDNEQTTITTFGFEPYFYIRAEERKRYNSVNNKHIERFEDAERDTLRGTDLAKVVVSSPGKVSEEREKFSKTWEADVQFTDRFRIDTEIKNGVKAPDTFCHYEELEPVEITEIDPRVLTFDIEVDDRGDGFPDLGEKRVLSIVAHDSYTDEYVGFIDLDGRSVQDVFGLDSVPKSLSDISARLDDVLDELKFERDERRMLIAFGSWVNSRDFDIVQGWNSNGFDTPYIIERMENVGANPDRMARGGYSKVKYYGGEPSPQIKGRTCYDMMDAWESVKYQEVDTSLNAAAEYELGVDSIEEATDEYYSMYENDPVQFLVYNQNDVELVVRIDEEAGVLDDRTELKDSVGVDYEDTMEANSFIEMLARRMLHQTGKAGPTKTPPETSDDDYEGAFTFPAFEGVRENVTGIDLASLYPMTLWMLNASPETKVDPDEVGDDVPVAEAPNGTHFRLDEDGLFKKLVSKAMELSNQAKRRRNQADPGTEEHEYWASKYASRKRIRNALYGVLGWEWFFLYDEDVAEAITTMSQVVIKNTAEYVNSETVGRVIYGDTDSTYIEWSSDWDQQDCLERTQELCETLNNDIYPSLSSDWGMESVECRWEIELELYAKRMFQAGKKKRYAMNIWWEEGMSIDDRLDPPEIEIKGFEFVRSDCPEILASLQEEVIEGIVTGDSHDAIREMVFDASQKITADDPDWELIGIPGGIGKELDEYESETAQVRAAKNANRLLDTNIGEGDKPMRCYLKHGVVDGEQIDVIAYNRYSDIECIEDDVAVDAERMVHTTIRKPMTRILEPLGIDVDATLNGQTQRGLDSFV